MDIAFDDHELAVKYDEGIDDIINWEDVIRITGYKVYAYPGEITFLVFTTNKGEVLEVSDEMSGWLELLGGLPTVFALLPGWEEQLTDLTPDDDNLLIWSK
ncbi:hypothetical protein SAMN05660909_01996 [Chitinophaga terrae (ex Kim and Jung 2007)]|uniref:Uncharacterized protein n=1 Tax=Chitinophaga terrae (ex Kim and Jung 2007) TaxID=408074 RepID=A0A1H4BA38_9BACT|nr:hypothetical protein [Chitinophaga terrae (ex Kim and Jung 2007)]MDQ0106264.1 hypothetical protein [Chitinophaga terrae (ex Kim and Jung 2007)]GEP92097.1 hypothetical protein CTE07_37420 [Chitinophaga terrae (ex Kim and Jung 2007)]SEA45010.1 hypothetical protein SAMN05660909_01996 [Chitinophaga terrae (ex Kim and Jung 2007)]